MSEQRPNKRTFEVELDGAKKTFAVLRPNNRVMQQARLAYNRAFRVAVEGGSLLRAKVDQVMREQGIWDDDKQARWEAVQGRLLEGERRLAKGGGSLSEAYRVALDMRRARLDRQDLRADAASLEDVTAESLAEQAQFNHLVAACTVDGDSGKPHFESAEDYLSREDDPVALPAAREMGKLFYGLEDDLGRSRLPEEKFLKKYGFADDKFRLVRRGTSQLVDEDGHPVDGQGRRVDDQGRLVDKDGNALTKEGEYDLPFEEFVDDLGTPAPVDLPAHGEEPSSR